jgi:hypothetical protein
MPQRFRSVPPAVSPDRRTFRRRSRGGHSSPGALQTSSKLFSYISHGRSIVAHRLTLALSEQFFFCAPVPLLHLRRSRIMTATDALHVSPDPMSSVYTIQYRYRVTPHHPMTGL